MDKVNREENWGNMAGKNELFWFQKGKDGQTVKNLNF